MPHFLALPERYCDPFSTSTVGDKTGVRQAVCLDGKPVSELMDDRVLEMWLCHGSKQAKSVRVQVVQFSDECVTGYESPDALHRKSTVNLLRQALNRCVLHISAAGLDAYEFFLMETPTTSCAVSEVRVWLRLRSWNDTADLQCYWLLVQHFDEIADKNRRSWKQDEWMSAIEANTTASSIAFATRQPLYAGMYLPIDTVGKATTTGVLRIDSIQGDMCHGSLFLAEPQNLHAGTELVRNASIRCGDQVRHVRSIVGFLQ